MTNYVLLCLLTHWAFRPRCCVPLPNRATRSPPHSRSRHSRRARRARRHGRRANRHRQDRRLHAAAAAAADGRPTPRNGRRHVRALMLTPTRELAAQVGESVQIYGKHLPLKTAVIFGGVSINPQIDAAAPRRRHPRRDAGPAARSRAAAHRRSCGTSRSSCSTKPTACSTWASCPTSGASSRCCRSSGRTCCSRPRSPTTSASSRTSSSHRPSASRSAPRNATAEKIEQAVYFADKGQKRGLLSWLIGSGDWRQVLVFTRTKHGANRLAEQLDARRAQRRGHPRQQEPGRAHARARGFQARHRARARRDRHRRARARHRPAAARRELRAARSPRGLCPPHRPHGPRGQRRPRGVARRARRAAAAESRSSDCWATRCRSGSPRATCQRPPRPEPRQQAHRHGHRSLERTRQRHGTAASSLAATAGGTVTAAAISARGSRSAGGGQRGSRY